MTYSRAKILRLSISLQLFTLFGMVPCIEQSLKQLNRVSSHIPFQFSYRPHIMS
jgi:hypothetical protein